MAFGGFLCGEITFDILIYTASILPIIKTLVIIGKTKRLKNLQNNALCDLSAVSSGAVPLTYCSKLINEEN